MMRTLSSRLTFFTKFLFSPFWFVLFGAATRSMFASGDGFGRGPGGSPLTKWVFLAMWIAGPFGLLWLGAGLKRVRMNDDALYVSNYRTEFRVPLRGVQRVSERRWLKNRPVTIEHRAPSGDLGRFSFMPSQAFQFLRGPHPVVNEISEAVRRAGGRVAA